MQHKLWKGYKDCLKSNRLNIKTDIDSWKKLALGRSELRIHVDDGYNSFEKERIEHAHFKRQLEKGNIYNVENVNVCRCQTCGRILFYKNG